MAKGFMCNGRRIFYIEQLGNSPSLGEWVVEVFYAPSYSETLYFDTEKEYLGFIQKNSPHCYKYFELFRLTKPGLNRQVHPAGNGV